ncbi:annexin D3 [Impatiens glandulifera]|uniref:annexin D3 n=1 Tax=Impatiens glandulifera TaxID=253017 RepID=UPI001FB15E3F|nr:annexin D3 [Impatiens glandulifera]
MATIRVPDLVPSPTEDCETLNKAFKGWGTDEKAIISLLGRRNTDQRRKIRETYQQIYKKSLIDELISELSGDFGKAMILWTYDPPERDARLANKALKSKKKDIKHFQVIVEIACANSPHHLMAVRQIYCSLFECSLEEDIAATVSLPLRKILVGLVTSYRYDGQAVNTNIANVEAGQLYDFVKRKQLDNDDLVWILSTRNHFQLSETFKCYKLKYGNSIEKDIVKCGKSTLESLVKTVVQCLDAPEKHFSEVIRASIVGFGTDEDSLTRAIVMRAEIDMMKVRGMYFIKNKTSLDNAVIGDTSGYYMDFLMTLLGANI